MVDAAPSYPLFLRVFNRRCVIVGGGAVAARKVDALLQRGADVRVIAPALEPGLLELAGRGLIEVEERRYAYGDLAGAVLAFAATGDREVNAAVAAEARARNIWVNVADDLGACDFIVPAVVERGSLSVAISTGGAAPALAARLRRDLEAWLGPEYEQLLAIMAEARGWLEHDARGPEARGEALRRLAASDVLDYCRRGALEEARARARRIVEEARYSEPGGRPGCET